MCGRFSFVANKEKIEEQFNIKLKSEMQSSYNIAPTHPAYVLSNDQQNQFQMLYWGLVPYWSNDRNNSGRLINARREGIAGKPSFRLPIRKRRCLVLADSFYEWKTYGKSKMPYRISLRNNNIMAIAGIWDEWREGNFNLKTFSIITTPPNKEMEMIHNRMPVIFTNDEEQQKWLSDIPLEEIIEMLKTIDDNTLRIYRVSEKLNSPQNNSEELHKEVLEPPTLFD